MENLYLRDFVEFYKKLGITNVVLYDNNDKNGEYPQQVIGDYISDGYVIYKDVRGKHRCQIESYTNCYKEYGNDYDWLLFFDVDEFVELYEDKDINSFLSRPKFNDADCIFIYWVQYGDSGLLHYDNRPVWERFTEHVNQYLNESNTFKLMVRGKTGLDISFFDANAFTFTKKEGVNITVKNTAGEDVTEEYPYQYWCYDCAALAHYQTLTVDEFLCRRFGRRSYADNASSFNKETIMNIFYSVCERTEEKDKIINEFLSKFDLEEDNV